MTPQLNQQTIMCILSVKAANNFCESPGRGTVHCRETSLGSLGLTDCYLQGKVKTGRILEFTGKADSLKGADTEFNSSKTLPY